MSANEDSVYSSESAFADSISVRKTSTAQSKLRSIPYLATKRIFDIFVGIIGCILLIPVACIVKIIYLAHGDKHPIFFTQKRIGKGGKEFTFYKFRTMVPDADKILKEYLKENEAAAEEYRINKKLKNDPRITRAGGLIRRSSIDEIPQFINVLKGDMSLIGNRPYMPREKKDIRADQFKILVSTKPGLTGFWQVSGRSNINFNDRIRMEVMYSENANLKFDLQIFFKTFKCVLSKDGAD